MTVKEAIQKTIDNNSLSQEEAHLVATEIMEGRATDAQIAGLLITLRLKGETIDESKQTTNHFGRINHHPHHSLWQLSPGSTGDNHPGGARGSIAHSHSGEGNRGTA